MLWIIVFSILLAEAKQPWISAVVCCCSDMGGSGIDIAATSLFLRDGIVVARL